MHGSRTGPLTAGLAAASLVLAVLCLRETPDPTLVARWWPATALATALVVVAARRHLAALLLLVAVVFFLAALVAGHGGLFSLGFAVANSVEVAVVVWWLSGFDADRPSLRSWPDYFRWLTAITLGGLAAGVITAGTLALTGADDLWRPLLWVIVTHVSGQAVVLPLFLRRAHERLGVRVVELLGHLALLGLAATACVVADPSQPVAFLLLPVLLWSAARFPPHWTSVELVVVALGLATLTSLDRGPFVDVSGVMTVTDLAASVQSFVGISAVTAVAFSVAMTHLRDSLRRIQNNEVQLSQLLDSASGTAFIATDLDGVITWFSPGAEQLLGYAASDVVGHHTPTPFHESREILVRAQQLRIPPGYGVVTHAVAAGADQDTRDWTYVRRDGSRLTVSISVTAVRDDDGHPVSYLSVVRDVTDRRAAEQALVFALDKERETNQRMYDLDRAKGEFVSSVSHELRTPLTSIVGYTELLADDDTGNLTGEQRQLVERIERNGERLLALVEDLLTLARVEDGSLALNRVETDLCANVRAATDEVAHAAHQGRVGLQVDLPAEPVLLLGDPHYLERLVLNLVSNAVKFTDAGGEVTVGVYLTGDVAQLCVRDTGMGIPLEEQHRLFQKFFRSSTATEHAIQGTGLGLHIVRSIAEAHHGEITFESTPGVGTAFWVTLPLIGADTAAPVAPAARPTQAAPGTDQATETTDRDDAAGARRA